MKACGDQTQIHEEDHCCLCLLPVGKHDDDRMLSRCKHRFHERCVTRWCDEWEVCPYCHRDMHMGFDVLPHWCFCAGCKERNHGRIRAVQRDALYTLFRNTKTRFEK